MTSSTEQMYKLAKAAFNRHIPLFWCRADLLALAFPEGHNNGSANVKGNSSNIITLPGTKKVP